MPKILTDEDLRLLNEAVAKRLERAENALLRDFFAQHGIENEELEKAKIEYFESKESEMGIRLQNMYLKGQYDAAKHFLEYVLERRWL